MIPDLIDLGVPTPWPVLPPGVYDATLAEIEAKFASTPHRQWLLGGFVRAAQALGSAGCQTVYLNGSFTTGKPHPDDFDGCWDHIGVDFSKLDPVLKTFDPKRFTQKQKYFGELFPAGAQGAPGLTFLQFFQIEKYSQRAKGILRISLGPQGATP